MCSATFIQALVDHDSITNFGFNFNYQIQNPIINGKIYWSVHAAGILMESEEVYYQAYRGKSCSGFATQTDEIDHLVYVHCDFHIGAYTLHMVFDIDGKGTGLIKIGRKENFLIFSFHFKRNKI